MNKKLTLNEYEPYLYNLGFAKIRSEFDRTRQEDKEYVDQNFIKKELIWDTYPQAYIFETAFGWNFYWTFEEGITSIVTDKIEDKLQPYLEQLLTLTDEEIGQVPGGRAGDYQYIYPDDIQEYCKILESQGAINTYLHLERLFYEKVYFEVYKNRKGFKPELFKYLNMFVEELKVK
jgi:hypothetical protein